MLDSFIQVDGVLYKRVQAKPDHRGYSRVGVGGKTRLYHRLVFALAYGYMPKVVDHIDGDPTNNHPSNLREATYNLNAHNTAPRKHAYKGVTEGRNGKWRATITIRGKRQALGTFKSIEEAAKAYDTAAAQEYGEHARFNFT